VVRYAEERDGKEIEALNVGFGRTFAVPGRYWKAGVLPNPAIRAVPKLINSLRWFLPRMPLIV
jgi:hypothetical protein